MSSSRTAQAVKARAVAARRASVERDFPALALGAQPAAQGAELEPGKVAGRPPWRQCQQACDIGEIGPHGMGGAAPFRLQIAAEAVRRPIAVERGGQSAWGSV